jgi:hypothetical protein
MAKEKKYPTPLAADKIVKSFSHPGMAGFTP